MSANRQQRLIQYISTVSYLLFFTHTSLSIQQSSSMYYTSVTRCPTSTHNASPITHPSSSHLLCITRQSPAIQMSPTILHPSVTPLGCKAIKVVSSRPGPALHMSYKAALYCCSSNFNLTLRSQLSVKNE